MIIVLKPDCSETQLEHICERIRDMGFRHEISRGVKRTLVGVLGDEDLLRNAPLRAIPGVEDVMSVLKPFKLASKEFKAEPSVYELGHGVKVGGGNLMLIAGPCAIEGEAILREIATSVKAAGANVLRGGAFKPRTSPYSFQGMGEDGLKMLRAIGDELKMPVVTEVMDPRQVDLVNKYADMFQIGARNMQNFELLKEVGAYDKPVLLKRGLSATIKEFLLSAEYIMSRGNRNVMLCERGIRTFETQYRNTLDMAAIPTLKSLSHLPVIVDPSHATGKWDLVAPMSKAAIAAGADGLLIEVHSNPECALCDGEESIRPSKFKELMGDLRKMAAAVDRTL